MTKNEKEEEIKQNNSENEEKNQEENIDENQEDTNIENPKETTEDIEETTEEPTDEQKIQELQQQLDEYKDKYQRAHADFENFKKRSIKEKQEFVKYANEGLILKVLEAYEDLGRALEVDEDKDLREGVELIYKKMDKILKEEGVEEIETEHQMFDPFKHEALLTQDSEDYKNNEIIQDIQKGYTLNSKVIRYSKVIVCKKQ